MSGQWHGGKGSKRRAGADDTKFRNNWDRIFGDGSNKKGEKVNGKGKSKDKEGRR